LQALAAVSSSSTIAGRNRDTWLHVYDILRLRYRYIPALTYNSKTNNIDTVRNCQKEFAFELPSVILARHSEHFLIKYKACDKAFCKSV